jgi:hypothetical protein
MDEKLKELLEEEIKAEIYDLGDLQAGSEAKSAAIESLAKLYKLKIEETQGELDSYNKKSQLAEQVKDRCFKLGIAAAEIILPLIFYAVWMKMGFKFEENGTYTSTTFRGLFNRFRPTKG